MVNLTEAVYFITQVPSVSQSCRMMSITATHHSKMLSTAQYPVKNSLKDPVYYLINLNKRKPSQVCTQTA
jgi:hypothetical protein